MLSAISNIERRLPQNKEDFNKDELVQVWMVHYLQIICEAARSISDEMKESNPSIPWIPIIGFRNLVVHEYFRIDLDVVWDIITEDIPPLKKQIQKIRQS